jgi:outer membrane protein OmpA-like peptidoglycan-associated protein
MGSDDIYGFRVAEKPGLMTLVVRGNVQDPGGIGIEKAFVRLYDPEGALIRETYSGEDGAFRVEIPWRENVRVVAGRERFETVDLGGSALNPEMVSGQPLKIRLTPVEAVVLQQADRTLLRMERFHFDSGSTRINSQIAGVLDQAAESLKKFPDLRVKIEAHTDSRGSANRNLELSQKRAEAIRDYLVSKGVPLNTFEEVTGYGEQQIINNCTDGVYCLDMLHKQNERYPFVVVNYNDL